MNYKQLLIATCTAIGLAAVTPLTAQVPTNPIAYYTLDYTGFDIGTDNLTLVVGGNSSSTTSRFGNTNAATHFDGTTGSMYTSTPGNYHPVTGSQITISLWYKTTTSISSAGLVDNSEATTSNGYGIDVYMGQIRFLGGGNSGIGLTIDNDGGWHHLLFTKNGAIGSWYVDGALISTTFGMVDLTTPTTGVNFTIAKRNDNTNFFDGDLDDIRIYNFAVDGNQASSMYHEHGYLTPSNSLVGHYPLDGNGIDFGTAPTNLVFFPNPTAQPAAIPNRFGEAGEALYFDGSNFTERIYASVNGTFGNYHPVLGDDISLAFWYRTNNSNEGKGIIDNSEVATANGFGIDIYNGLRFLGGGTNFGSGIALDTDNNWHHVVFRKTANVGEFFVDGVSVGSTNAMTALTAPTAAIDFAIGGRNISSFDYGFVGALDDIRIYNYAISNGHIDTLFGNYVPISFCDSFSVSIDTFATGNGCADYITFSLAGGFPMNIQMFWNGGASSGGIATANSSTYTFTGVCPENYFAVFTDANGCTDTLYFSNMPCALDLAASNATDESSSGACDGLVDLTATSGLPNYVFSFFLAGQAMGGTTNSNGTTNVSGLCAGNWMFYVTDGAGCTDSVAVTVSTQVGISQVPNNWQLSIFPNPAQNTVNIAASAMVQYTLFDLTGKPLRQNLVSAPQHQISVADLPKGVYFLQLTDGKETTNQKIILTE